MGIKIPKKLCTPGLCEQLAAVPDGCRALQRRGWFRLRKAGLKPTAHDLLAYAKVWANLGKDARVFVDHAVRTGEVHAIHDLGIELPPEGIPSGAKEYLLRHHKKDPYELARIACSWELLITQGWEPNSKASMEAARAVMAASNYRDVRDHALAMEAARWGIYESEFFNTQGRWIARTEARKHWAIPAPGGAKGIVSGPLRLVQLDGDDPRALFVGYHTGCCQHPLGEGWTCAWHSVESPVGAVWAVEMHGRILAQAWVWRDRDTLVLDNIEAMGHKSHAQKIEALFLDAAQEVVRRKALGVEKVMCGTGMSDITFDREKEVPPPSPPGCYSDAHGEAWVLAR